MTTSFAKRYFDDRDFEEMNWHDVPIHSIAFVPEQLELMFDLDYIFEWVLDKNDNSYSFWISPATLVFRSVDDFKISFTHLLGSEIVQINREALAKKTFPANGGSAWMYNIELVQGNISFSANGFSQYIRRAPVLLRSQRLTLEQRQGICFNKGFVD